MFHSFVLTAIIYVFNSGSCGSEAQSADAEACYKIKSLVQVRYTSGEET